jgi:mRNA-degrading endonuclease RelE of RelBE toxin-antitoxin system
MYEVRIPPKVEREIKKLSGKLRSSVIEALMELKIDPFIGKPLKMDLTGRYTYHVDGYRIIYKTRQLDRIVVILKVKPRSVVYN